MACLLAQANKLFIYRLDLFSKWYLAKNGVKAISKASKTRYIATKYSSRTPNLVVIFVKRLSNIGSDITIVIINVVAKLA